MLRRCLVAAGVALALFPAAASAQNDPHHSSTGFRLEGLVGYENAAFDSISQANGLLYGVGLGYDIGRKRMRFGLEGEVTDSTARRCLGFAAGAPPSVCLRTARDLYVGARFGVEVSPGVLLYGKAGYSNYGQSNVIATSAGKIVTHPHFDGIRVGAGAELAVGSRAFVKTEFRFTNYERSQDFHKHQAVLGFGIRF
jgi:outer membrane immunogenic protein